MMSFLASMVVVPPAPRAGLAAETVEMIYVKAVGGSDDNDGQSWDTAFATLQKALDAAEPGDDVRVEIWLAAGTYYPTKDAAGNDTGGSSATFRMKNGVTIYGGFPADADDGIDLDERGWEAHPTVLSGDLNKNGTLDFGTDAQHVIFNEGLDETAVLDGVIITGGISPDDGGGVYNKNSSPVFRH